MQGCLTSTCAISRQAFVVQDALGKSNHVIQGHRCRLQICVLPETTLGRVRQKYGAVVVCPSTHQASFLLDILSRFLRT